MEMWTTTDAPPATGVLVVGMGPDFLESLRRVAHHLKGFGTLLHISNLSEASDPAVLAQTEIMLLRLPLEDNGDWDAIGALLAQESPPQIVAICDEETESTLYEALCIGATALVSLQVPREFIVSTILRVRRGEAPIEYSLVGRVGLVSYIRRRLSDEVRRLGHRAKPCSLSPRELHVLEAIARGQANKEIARQLGITEQTVKNYISTILRRLNARDRAHAATIALTHGWISPRR